MFNILIHFKMLSFFFLVLINLSECSRYLVNHKIILPAHFPFPLFLIEEYKIYDIAFAYPLKSYNYRAEVPEENLSFFEY